MVNNMYHNVKILSKRRVKVVFRVVLTGLPSPRGSAGKDWTVLEAAPNSLGPSSESVPTWGKVLGSLKSWGIAPATQSAATSRIFTGPGSPQDVTSNPQGQGVSASQPHSDDESRLLEGGARAVSDSEGLKAPLARRGSLRRGRSRGEAGSSSSQQQDRLRNSLDGSQVHSCSVGDVLAVNSVVKALLQRYADNRNFLALLANAQCANCEFVWSSQSSRSQCCCLCGPGEHIRGWQRVGPRTGHRVGSADGSNHQSCWRESRHIWQNSVQVPLSPASMQSQNGVTQTLALMILSVTAGQVCCFLVIALPCSFW